MNKHTHGLWIAEGCTVYQSPQWKDGKDLGSRFIAMALQGEIPSEEDLANARLIAAAPELLEACEALALFNISCVNTPFRDNAHELKFAIDKAHAAIAKAVGEPT